MTQTGAGGSEATADSDAHASLGVTPDFTGEEGAGLDYLLQKELCPSQGAGGAPGPGPQLGWVPWVPGVAAGKGLGG